MKRDLRQSFLDDDDSYGRHRAATLDTIEEGDEDENSELDIMGDGTSPGSGKEVGTATLVGSTFQMANCAIGAGVLAFPYAFANCGLAVGILMLVYLIIIVGATQLVVIKAAAVSGAPSYEDMVRRVLGAGWGKVLEVVILVYQLGACVAYLDVVADQGTGIMCAYGASFFGSYCDGNQTLMRAILVAVIAFGFCLPFSIPTKIDALARISMIGVLAPIVMSCAIVVLGLLDISDRGMAAVVYNLKWVPDSETGLHDVLKSIPIVLFALQSHIVAPSVYKEMKPEIKSVKNASIGMVFAYLMVGSCYMLTGIFGYTQFGNGVDGDLLKTSTVLSQSKGDVLVAVINGARVFIALGSLCSFPLNHFPGRSALLNLAVPGKPLESLPKWAFYLEATLFVAVCYGLAVAVPQISYVFSIMGATCGTAVMFIFPAMLHLNLPKYEKRERHMTGDSFDDVVYADGSLVDVASGRRAQKIDPDEDKTNSKAKRDTVCRWLFFVIIMGMGCFVVITGTMSAVQDFITNLLDA